MAVPEKMPEQAAAEDKPAPPKFVERIGGAKRSETVTLDWPVEYDGKVWTEITVSRMTVGELQTFFSDDSDGKVLPMFDAPPEVMNGLDPDDDDNIKEVVMRFFPRRLRPAADTAPNVESGATMQPTPAGT